MSVRRSGSDRAAWPQWPQRASISAAWAAAVAVLLQSEAHAQGWQDLSALGGPPGNRQMGSIVDVPRNRLVAAGGENSDGQTWALPLDGTGGWTPLTWVPDDAQDVVRAVYDSQHERMLLLVPSMTVYALDLVNPTGWEGLPVQGPVPPPRSYPGVAYDASEGRLLIFGGLGGPGNDVWALDLEASPPTWSQIVPSNTGPASTWSAVAVHDPVRDRLVVATGQPLTNQVWALDLAGSHAWTPLAQIGPHPPLRYLSAGIYDPVGDALVICAGYSLGALNDIWTLPLGPGAYWTPLPAPTGSPQPRWSHAAAYSPGTGQLIMHGGWSGGWHADVWGYQLAPASGPPTISGFDPPGGSIGDQVVISGFRLSSPTSVRFGAVPAPVLSSTFSQVVTQVPVGATPVPSKSPPQRGPR